MIDFSVLIKIYGFLEKVTDVSNGSVQSLDTPMKKRSQRSVFMFLFISGSLKRTEEYRH